MSEKQNLWEVFFVALIFTFVGFSFAMLVNANAKEFVQPNWVAGTKFDVEKGLIDCQELPINVCAFTYLGNWELNGNIKLKEKHVPVVQSSKPDENSVASERFFNGGSGGKASFERVIAVKVLLSNGVWLDVGEKPEGNYVFVSESRSTQLTVIIEENTDSGKEYQTIFGSGLN